MALVFHPFNPAAKENIKDLPISICHAATGYCTHPGSFPNILLDTFYGKSNQILEFISGSIKFNQYFL
jgi:hypothetical protein